MAPSRSGAAGGRPHPASSEHVEWEARNAVDSTEDPRHEKDGRTPSRFTIPPAPAWQAFGTSTDVREWAPPVDPALLSPPTGIPLHAEGAVVPPPELVPASPVLGATLRPPLARGGLPQRGAPLADRVSPPPASPVSPRTGVPTLAARPVASGDRPSSAGEGDQRDHRDPRDRDRRDGDRPEGAGPASGGSSFGSVPFGAAPFGAAPFGSGPAGSESGRVSWGEPFPALPRREEEPTPSSSGHASVPIPLGGPTPTLSVPTATGEVRWFDPVVVPDPSEWDGADGGEASGADAAPGADAALDLDAGDRSHPVVPFAAVAPARPADPATIAFPLPVGDAPPLTRRARRAAEQAQTSQEVPVAERPEAPLQDPFAFSPPSSGPAPMPPAPMPPMALPPAAMQPAAMQPAPMQPAPMQPAPMQPMALPPAPVPPAPMQPAPMQPAPMQPVPMPPVELRAPSPYAPLPQASPQPHAPHVPGAHDEAEDWVELPAFARPATDEVWFANAAPGAPDPVLKMPGLVPPGAAETPFERPPAPGMASAAAASTGLFPGVTGPAPTAPQPAPQAPPVPQGPPVPQAAPSFGPPSFGPPSFAPPPLAPPPAPTAPPAFAAPPPVAPVQPGRPGGPGQPGGYGQQLPADPAAGRVTGETPLHRDRGDRERADVRPTGPVPVIRPPVQLRRPDDDEPTDVSTQPTVVRPAPGMPTAKELFTAPVARPKDGSGDPEDPGARPGAANLAPPQAPPAVPSPVAPKPPSLEASLDPAAMAGRSGPTVPFPTSSPGQRPGTSSVVLPLSGPARGPSLPPSGLMPAAASQAPPFPAGPPAVAAGSASPGPDADLWPGPSGPGLLGGDLQRAPWADLSDPARPSTTIVPARGRGSRASRRRDRPVDTGHQHVAADEPSLEGDVDGQARSRMLSLMVFWAPAIILLVLAGIVVWVVR